MGPGVIPLGPEGKAGLHPFGASRPVTGRGVLICPGAQVVGDVTLGDRASVWFNAVIRGDLAPVTVGAETNVQDGAVLHVDTGVPLCVGARVTVGHGAILHACTVGDGALIGMGAIVLSGAAVGEEALVGAGALVPEGKVIPPRCLALGVPARVVRELTPEEVERLGESAARYVALAARYLAGLGFE